MAEQRKNRASPSEAASHVEALIAHDAETERMKMAHMREWQSKLGTRQTERKEMLDDAKKNGVTKALCNTLAKAAKMRRKAEALFEELEQDDAAFAKDIREHLGDFHDTPLGAAAVAADDASKKRHPDAQAILDHFKAEDAEEASATMTQEEREKVADFH